MASSQPTPPSAGSPPPPPTINQQQQQQQANPQNPTLNKHIHENPYLRPIALFATPLALLGLWLPPRKLDIRALILGGVGIWGTNQLALEYTGKSFAQRTSARLASFAATMEMPDKARAAQGKLREEKERREKLRVLREEMVRKGDAPAPKGKVGGGSGGDVYEGWTDAQKRALLEAYERERRGVGESKGGKKEMGKEMEKKEMGWLQRLWLGDADPDWKEKRDQKEREALQEGGVGYWGLITEQISEVWNGEKKEESAKGKTGDDVKK